MPYFAKLFKMLTDSKGHLINDLGGSSPFHKDVLPNHLTQYVVSTSLMSKHKLVKPYGPLFYIPLENPQTIELLMLWFCFVKYVIM